MNSVLVLVSAALFAQTPTPASWRVDASRSSVAFDLKHALHGVHGESRSIEARAVLREGTALVMARIPVSTFRSGDANRDAHMLEVLESNRHPHVVLKATVPLELPGAFPAVLEIVATGTLDFHGRTRPIEIPLTLEFAAPGELRVRSRFAVSLEAFEVERPSLFFVKIDDETRLSVDLTMSADTR
jgi:polyisoprenoid-binding protein YceI